MKKIVSISCLVLISNLLTQCAYDRLEEVSPQAVFQSCDTTEVTYSQNIEPIIKNRCIFCHTRGNGSGADLSDYESVKLWAEKGILLPLIKHTRQPQMPADGTKLSECQIAMFSKWIETNFPR